MNSPFRHLGFACAVVVGAQDGLPHRLWSVEWFISPGEVEPASTSDEARTGDCMRERKPDDLSSRHNQNSSVGKVMQQLIRSV